MRLFDVDAECPVCGNRFRSAVLAAYEVARYEDDFCPVFEKNANLLKYFIWFCSRCHNSGYENRFSYAGNEISYDEERIESIRSLKKERRTPLAYKFFKAGEISEITGESPITQMDYYLKSYWAAKRSSAGDWKNKSSEKIITVGGELYQVASNEEDLFISLYLPGYIYMEKGAKKEAALEFSRLLKMKTLPAAYDRYLKVALEFLRRYKNES